MFSIFSHVSYSRMISVSLSVAEKWNCPAVAFAKWSAENLVYVCGSKVHLQQGNLYKWLEFLLLSPNIVLVPRERSAVSKWCNRGDKWVPTEEWVRPGRV